MDVARVSMQEKGEVKHVEDEKSEEVKPEVLASPEEILEALRVKVERLDAAVVKNKLRPEFSIIFFDFDSFASIIYKLFCIYCLDIGHRR